MNACKVLDSSPGMEMTSWGTVHFPEEKRIMEWVVAVVNGRWRSLRYGPCQAAPSGGFDEIRKGHGHVIDQIADSHPQARLELVCKENVTAEQVVKLVLAELQRAGFPHNIEQEAKALRARLEMCARAMPIPGRGVKSRRRFEVD